jgi:hypothetical protein
MGSAGFGASARTKLLGIRVPLDPLENHNLAPISCVYPGDSIRRGRNTQNCAFTCPRRRYPPVVEHPELLVPTRKSLLGIPFRCVIAFAG